MRARAHTAKKKLRNRQKPTYRRGLAVACWITDHYHPCSNLGVGISAEGCCIFDFISFGGHSAHSANNVHKSGRKTSIIIIIIIYINMHYAAQFIS